MNAIQLTARKSCVTLLAVSVLFSGCAQFMAPAQTSEYFTAADREAFYSMVNQGVVQSVAGLSLLFLVSRISEQLPSEEAMRTKWVPRGIRAYVEDNYVTGAEERQAWRFTGTGIYDAAFSRNNNKRLFQPAANLAYFCTEAGGSFRLRQPDTTPFRDPYSLRPHDEDFALKFEQKDPYQLAAPLFPVADAQKHGAFGYFTCTMPDGRQAWWAKVTPAPAVLPVFGSSWTMPTQVTAHETPLNMTPPVPNEAISRGEDAAMAQAFRTSKPARFERDTLLYEAWLGGRLADRWGCRVVYATATLGDLIIANGSKVMCS